MNMLGPEPRIALSTWGRFHFFHLARQLDRHHALDRILSTYPRFKLRGEGIPADRLYSCGGIELTLRAKERLGLRWPALDDRLEALKVARFDRFIARHIGDPDIYIALSGSGGHVGPQLQKRGRRYICDRGSTHIEHGDELLTAEFARYGLSYKPTYAPFVAREIEEYRTADLVVVPSSFAARTYVERGVPADRLFVNPYGVSLGRFGATAEPEADRFTVLFVGAAGIRKGFGYLLEAFAALRHPHKRLWVAGAALPETGTLVRAHGSDGAEFLGRVPNERLAELYSRANVMVLPSVEDGFGMVMAEALACGCPVVASSHTGARDLFDDGVEGFVVPARDPKTLAGRLQQLADTPALARRMGRAGQARMKRAGGWDSYGDRYLDRCRELMRNAA